MSHFAPLPYLGVDELDGLPHLVVDGAGRPGTLLCLSHWPGTEAPEALRRDLSVEMVFAYLERPRAWVHRARAVTNDHLDEDGLASLFALVAPEQAIGYRERLIAFGRLGDFDVVTDDAILHSVLAARALRDPGRGGLVVAEPGEREGSLSLTTRTYRALLDRLPELLEHPERQRSLYGEQLAAIEGSRATLASGRVKIEEHLERDLAIVRSCEVGCYPFGHRHSLPLDPVVLHSATTCTRVASIAPGRLSLHDRYESWVLFRSRPLPRRRDLGALALRLSEEEPGDANWRADPPGALVAVLDHEGESEIAGERFVELCVEHLENAPAAWDPEAPRPTRRTS